MANMLLRSCLVLLAACAALSAQAAPARTLTVLAPSGFTTLDPRTANDTLSQHAAKAFYEGLFGFDPLMNRVPVLASSWNVSRDGRVYTVRLRPNVRFSDGELLDAAAVQSNFERLLRPQMSGLRASLLEDLLKVEAVDPMRVRFTLRERNPGFLNVLAHPAAAMLCPRLLAEELRDPRAAATRPCGTGPYVLESFSPLERLSVRANPSYRIPGQPRFERIVFEATPSSEETVEKLRSGAAQFALSVSPRIAEAVSDVAHLSAERTRPGSSFFVAMNVTKKPFSDRRVRQALNYAVDQRALCRKVWNGWCTPLTGFATRGVAYAKQFAPWSYDPAHARRLLAQAGYPKGFEATLWSATDYTASVRALEFLRGQLAAVGVRVTVRALNAAERSELLENVSGPKDSKLDMVYLGWSSATGDLDGILRPTLSASSWPPALANFGFYSNREADRALSEALRTDDGVRRKEIYDRAQEILWQDAPWIFLSNVDILSVRDRRLQGFHQLPDGGMDFSRAYWKED